MPKVIPKGSDVCVWKDGPLKKRKYISTKATRDIVLDIDATIFHISKDVIVLMKYNEDKELWFMQCDKKILILA